MKAYLFAHTIRRFRTNFGDHRVTLLLGLLIMGLSVLSAVLGVLSIAMASTTEEITASAMLLLGCLYLFLTGIWVTLRASLNARRTLGLSLMLAGILVGTCCGISLATARVYGDFSEGHLVFIGGLLVHLAGVLYVRKE